MGQGSIKLFGMNINPHDISRIDDEDQIYSNRQQVFARDNWEGGSYVLATAAVMSFNVYFTSGDGRTMRAYDDLPDEVVRAYEEYDRLWFKFFRPAKTKALYDKVMQACGSAKMDAIYTGLRSRVVADHRKMVEQFDAAIATRVFVVPEDSVKSA